MSRVAPYPLDQYTQQQQSHRKNHAEINNSIEEGQEHEEQCEEPSSMNLHNNKHDSCLEDKGVEEGQQRNVGGGEGASNQELVVHDTTLNPNTEPEPEPATTLYTCRICLEEGPSLHANTEPQLEHMLELIREEPTSYLISTCNCNGTSGYVHESCMCQWIDAQYKRTKERHIKCEICLCEIVYNRKSNGYYDCNDCNKAWGRMSACNIACVLGLFIVIFMLVVVLAGWETFELPESKITFNTLIALIVVVSVAFALSLGILVKEAFYRIKKRTVKVYSTDECEIFGIGIDMLSHYDVTSRTSIGGRSVGGRSARSIGGRSATRERSIGGRSIGRGTSVVGNGRSTRTIRFTQREEQNDYEVQEQNNYEQNHNPNHNNHNHNHSSRRQLQQSQQSQQQSQSNNHHHDEEERENISISQSEKRKRRNGENPDRIKKKNYVEIGKQLQRKEKNNNDINEEYVVAVDGNDDGLERNINDKGPKPKTKPNQREKRLLKTEHLIKDYDERRQQQQHEESSESSIINNKIYQSHKNLQFKPSKRQFPPPSQQGNSSYKIIGSSKNIIIQDEEDSMASVMLPIKSAKEFVMVKDVEREQSKKHITYIVNNKNDKENSDKKIKTYKTVHIKSDINEMYIGE